MATSGFLILGDGLFEQPIWGLDRDEPENSQCQQNKPS